MAPDRTCSECGRRLPPGASELLCPFCALADMAAEDLAKVVARVDPGPIPPEAANRTQGLPPGSNWTEEPPIVPPLAGSFGDYELIEEIARGGMGVVYKARQRSLDRLVALKMVLGGPLASAAMRKRFFAEAQAAAGLQHPNIIAIHEVGEHRGQPFFSMDYVEGRNLAELLREGPLPPRRAVAYVKTIAEAVAYAHAQGILHRDLKPSNVLLDRSDQPRITDFGLAKRLSGATDHGLWTTDLTLSGQVLGSPNFMAPEQAQGRSREVGPPSDVYSMGALLYHSLTGRPPFQAATLTEVLRQVATTDPPAPALLNPSIPRDLETICLKCLEKDITRRYPTAQALADELGRFLRGEPILARPLGRVGKAAKWCRRNPRLAGAVGAAVVCLLIGLAGVAWQWRRAESQRARAEAEALLAQRNAYAADMKEVQRALEDSDLGRARELLDRHWPRGKSEVGSPKSEVDLRDWEWRYLWSRCQSDERFTFCRCSNVVSGLAFSANGQWLAIRHEGGAVVLWDAAAKQVRSVLPAQGHGWCNKALAFSPRGTLLAWSDIDTNKRPLVRLQDLHRQKEFAPLIHPAPIRSLAFSPDSKSLATLANDGTARVWDIEASQIMATLRGSETGSNSKPASPELPETGTSAGVHTNAPGAIEPELPEVQAHLPTSPVWSDHYGCVLFSPDGRWLAVGEAHTPRIRLWDRSGLERTPIAVRAPADGISALAFSGDSKLLVAGCGIRTNDIHVWDLADGTAFLLTGHSGWITALAFSPDGGTLASTSSDETTRLWDMSLNTVRQQFQGNTDEIWALAWSPDGKSLLTGAKDGSVRGWDPAARPAAPYVVLPELVRYWGPAFLPDSRSFLAVTALEGAVVRWDAITGQAVERLSFLGTNHSTMDLSCNGRWLAVHDAAGSVGVWDYPERRMLTNFVIPPSQPIALFFSPRGNLLACGAHATDGAVLGKIWAVNGWRELNLQGINLQGGLQATISPDERTLAVGYLNGTAIWWDLTSRRQWNYFPCHYASGVRMAFSPDGRLFATGGLDGLVTIWDTATRESRPFGRTYRNGLQDLAFSPDGRRLMASGTSPRGTVKLWDVETGREVMTLAAESRWFCRIGFSPDGNTLFAASSEGRALLWHAPSFEEIQRREGRRASAE